MPRVKLNEIFLLQQKHSHLPADVSLRPYVIPCYPAQDLNPCPGLIDYAILALAVYIIVF